MIAVLSVLIGAPTGSTVIRQDDDVLVYGRLDHLQDLDNRHKGRGDDRARLDAVREQHDIIIAERDLGRSEDL